MEPFEEHPWKNQLFSCVNCWEAVNPEKSPVYYCKICPNYFLCGSCKRSVDHTPGHHRIFIKCISYIVCGKGEDVESNDTSEFHEESIPPQNPIIKDMEILHRYTNMKKQNRYRHMKCLFYLKHAMNCDADDNCRDIYCRRMKNVLFHIHRCLGTHTPGDGTTCQTCKQFISVCTFHAVSCKNPECFVPLCLRIRNAMVKTHELETRRHWIPSIPTATNKISIKDTLAIPAASFESKITSPIEL